MPTIARPFIAIGGMLLIVVSIAPLAAQEQIAAVLPPAAQPLAQQLQATAPNDDAYIELLLDGVATITDVADAEASLVYFLPQVRGRSNRHRVYRYMATLTELAFNLSAAQHYYHQAYRTTIGSAQPDWDALLCSASILLELSDYDQSHDRSLTVLERASDSRLRERASVILARIDAYRGDSARALARLEGVIEARRHNAQPLAPTLLTLYDLAHQEQEQRYIEMARQLLQQYYPNSVAQQLASAENESPITFIPTPTRLLSEAILSMPPEGLADETPVGDTMAAALSIGAPASTTSTTFSTTAATIDTTNNPSFIGVQTGSFRSEGNGRRMVQSLARIGFQARNYITEVDGERYFQVVIPVAGAPDMEKAQRLLVQLKEHNIDGFLLFAEPQQQIN